MSCNVMKVTGVASDGVHMCECEHSNCVHPKKDKPCVYWALTKVCFEGAGSFWLCDAGLGTYMSDGFELIP